MAATETFRSTKYDPTKINGRYVQMTRDGKFYWIETQTIGTNRFDVRGGFVDDADLPDNISDAAEARRLTGVWPFYVDWAR